MLFRTKALTEADTICGSFAPAEWDMTDEIIFSNVIFVQCRLREVSLQHGMPCEEVAVVLQCVRKMGVLNFNRKTALCKRPTYAVLLC